MEEFGDVTMPKGESGDFEDVRQQDAFRLNTFLTYSYSANQNNAIVSPCSCCVLDLCFRPNANSSINDIPPPTPGIFQSHKMHT